MRARNDGHRLFRGARGLTLVDVLLTAVVLSIIAIISIPALRFDDPVRLISAATLITADLEYAQSATLAAPDDPVIVVFDSDNPRYWLALASKPDKPIPRPGSGDPFDVYFGKGNLPYLAGISLKLAEGGDQGAVKFDAFGRLDPPTDARIQVVNASGDIFVVVAANTGSVSMSEN